MFFMRYGYAALSICTHYFIMLNSGFWALSLTFDDLICKFTKVPASCPIARSRGTPASKVISWGPPHVLPLLKRDPFTDGRKGDLRSGGFGPEGSAGLPRF